jgi:diadenosine tetraphosphate (Ap4A) HIT family hydrolase
MTSPPDCLFCRKLAALDSLPAGEVVWRFPHGVALLGTHQFYLGYCVLVSRTHSPELSALADDERRAFLDEMCLLARAIERCYRPHKLNYELLGNQVPHLHWHLFPRSFDDPEVRKPVWLALERAEHDPELRRKLAGGVHQTRPNIAAALAKALTELDAPCL